MALRFAVSPLWETIAGLRVPAAPSLSPVHRRWIAWAERRLLDLGEDRSLLHVLVTRPVVPEFLIPTPGVRSERVGVEIDAVAKAGPERIAAAVDDPRLPADPPRAIAAMQERLHAVHDAIIAPIWPPLEGVLQGDVERRGRRMVEAGGRTDRAGRAAPGRVVPQSAPDRGRPDRRHRRAGPRAGHLGVHVTEPATRLGVTVGAVSQHLGVLRAAGLAVSRREGREVVSLRTGLGLALVQGEVP